MGHRIAFFVEQVSAQFDLTAAFVKRRDASNDDARPLRTDRLRCVNGACEWRMSDAFTWGPDIGVTTYCHPGPGETAEVCGDRCSATCSATVGCAGWCSNYGACYLRAGPTGGVVSIDADSWCAQYAHPHSFPPGHSCTRV